jgi:hypothetical protein
MICKTCKKPVIYAQEDYIKFSSPTDGVIFHHLECWKHGVPKENTKLSPILMPYTAMGEPA